MKKFIIWTIVLLIAGFLGWFGYKWYTSRGTELNTFSLIPGNAIYVLETDKPIDAWKKISSTQTWQHLQGNAWFGGLTASANSLDSLIKGNDKLFGMIGKKTVLFSTHMTSLNGYDFLIVADLGDASGIKFMESYINDIDLEGVTFSKDKIGETEVIKMFSKSDKSTMYLCMLERYLICSYNRNLLEASLKAKDASDNLSTNPRLTESVNAIGTSGFARVYMNYEMLNSYVYLFTGPDDNVRYLSDNLNFSGMYLDVNDEFLQLKGTTWLHDSSVSYFSALLTSGKGPHECAEVAPERTAFYLGLGFRSFPEFYKGLQDNLKKDVKDYNEYMDNIHKTEKFLNISVQEDFVNWIEDEIALLQLQSAGKGMDNEVALVLKAANIEKAKERLEHIEKMIKRRTPVKFKSVEYKDYRISYLSVKGLFKAVLGKFFARYDKPYYTIINNYVIFSNHPQTLESIIDDYLDKKTLAKSDTYKTFHSKLPDESTVFVYLNTPKVFQSMKNLATAETKASMDSNKQYITCFRHVAFQMVADGNHFNTLLCEQFEKPDSVIAVTAIETISADSLDAIFELPYIYVKDPNAEEYKEYYPDSSVHFEVELKYGFKDGHFTEYHTNGAIKLKGKFEKDKRKGNWKAFNENGDMIGKRDYDE